jgi:hypothetical protein
MRVYHRALSPFSWARPGEKVAWHKSYFFGTRGPWGRLWDLFRERK